MIRALLPLLALCTAGAATVNDVLPATLMAPDLSRVAWLDYEQDNFAFGPDDGYTAGFKAGTDLGDAGAGWRVMASWGIYTDRDAGTRQDEALATLQRRFQADWAPGASWTAGTGLWVAGDLGGEAVQDAWHHLTGEERFDLVYEGGTHWSPVVAGAVEVLLWDHVGQEAGFGLPQATFQARGGIVAHLDALRAQGALAMSTGTVGLHLVSLEALVEFAAGDVPLGTEGRTWNAGMQGNIRTRYVRLGLFVSQDRSYGTIGLVY